MNQDGKLPIRIQLFGIPQVYLNGEPWTPPSSNAMRVLAYLAVKLGKPAPREAVAELFWPGHENNRESLRVELMKLRRSLAPLDHLLPKQGRMNISLVKVEDEKTVTIVDVVQFRELIAEKSLDSFKKAIGLYEGRFMYGYSGNWESEIAMEYEDELYEALCQVILSIPQTEVQQKLKYFRIMEKHCAIQYSEWRAMADSLKQAISSEGVVSDSTPSSQNKGRLLSSTSAIEANSNRTYNARQPQTLLPAAPPMFSGRLGELKRLSDALLSNRQRLTNIVGFGGLGKTRLMLEFGEQLASRSGFRVVYVPLEEVSSEQAALLELANRLRSARYEFQGSTLDVINNVLKGDTEVVLLLDGIESLIKDRSAVPSLDATGINLTQNIPSILPREPWDFIRTILESNPNVSFVCTSQVPIDVQEEFIITLPPLEVPSKGITDVDTLSSNESVKCYLSWVQKHGKPLVLTSQNAPAIRDLCRFLDGIPLSLTLAAAQAATLPADLFLKIIKRRLDIPSLAGRGVTPRHRRLNACIDVSYQQISNSTQTLFQITAIFSGGFTLEAISGISSDVMEENQETIRYRLQELLVSNFVYEEIWGGNEVTKRGYAEGLHANEPRYRMFETIREFGLDKLVVSKIETEARHRHARYYLQLVEKARSNAHGPERGVSLNRFGEDRLNVENALDYFLDNGDTGPALHLIGLLGPLYIDLGLVASGYDRLTTAFLRFKEDGSSYKDQVAVYYAQALDSLGLLARIAGELDVAGRYFSDMLQVASGLDDNNLTACALIGSANVSFVHRDLQSAKQLAEQCLILNIDPEYLARAQEALANIAATSRNYDVAVTLYEQVQEIYSSLNDDIRYTRAIYNRAKCLNDSGRYHEAFQGYKQSLERRLGDQHGMLYSLEGLASSAIAHNEWAVAVTLLVGTQNIRSQSGAQIPFDSRDKREEGLRECRKTLGDENYLKIEKKANTMTLEELCNYGQSLVFTDVKNR